MKIKYITLQLQNMAQSEIIGIIDKDVLEDIKKSDPHPLFKVFSVAHEGVSHGNVIGIGKVALRWLQNAIRKIHERIEYGTKLFHNHIQGTNSHDGRTIVGRVVGKTLDIINDKLHTLSVAYIYPEFKDVNFDIASFEGDVLLPRDLTNEPIINPQNIGKITGIAVGSSENTSPAFKGATLQTALQMMSDGGIGENMTISLKEIMNYLKENPTVRPSTLFTKEAVLNDSVIQDAIKEGKADLWHQNERLKLEKEELKKKVVTAEEETKKLKTSKLKTESVAKRDSIIKDRNLADNVVKFAVKRYDKDFNATTEENLTTDINKFLDEVIADFKELQDAGVIPKDSNDTSGNEDDKDALAGDAEKNKGKKKDKADKFKEVKKELMSDEED